MPRRLLGAGALALALLVVAPGAARAQAPAVVSPEVTHTGTGPTGYTVTFRIYDPTAARMRIRGEWFFSGLTDTTTSTSAGRAPVDWRVGDFPIASPNNGAAANWPVADMTLDPSSGVWSYTTPMPSGTYTYGYYRNCNANPPGLNGCTEISDPANPPFNLVGGVNQGAVEPTSQVYVPSDPPFGTRDLSQEAPNAAAHGTVVDLTYPDPESTNPAGSHYLAVYTPPGYDAQRALPYPTLYISHGAGGNEVDWFTQGVAGRIVDNLLAAGKMQPAVVVATNFNGLPNGVVGYQNDVLNRVIPFVEGNFNVSHRPADRAFAGLSAGAQRANQIIFNATAAFEYYGSWSIGTGGAPAAGSPLYQNPELKSLYGLVIGGGRFDSITVSKATLEQRLTDAGVPFTDDTIDGGHEWYTWRLLLNHFGASVAFRQTSTSVSAVGPTVTATVTPGTAEPSAPTGSVTFSAGGHTLGTAPLSGGKASLAVTDTFGGSAVTATYGGDTFYNASSGSVPMGAASGTVTGTVPATLSLVLGPAASFSPFVAGVVGDYTASTTATVTSTAGDAALTVSDPSTVAPGHLVNGTFSLPSALLAGGSALPSVVKTWSGPTSNEPVTVAFTQHIGSTDALRTGTYSKTLTYTLSTTNP